MSFTWTDEIKEQAVQDYVAAEPTPENSMELVKEMADELGCTANGLRTVLSRAKVYVKKVPAAKAASSGGTTTKKVSKADAVQKLNSSIEALGLEPDESIISKLTGKAALYFAEVIETKTPTEED
jgi:hypothetical protein